IEKPKFIYPVSMGVYVYNRRALEYIPPVKYFDFPDLVLRLLEKKQMVMCYESDEIWLDIGRRDDYLEAQEVFQKNRERFMIPV
ncbi:MAG TPA: sugar phosphate nucleotidyltransferase, partial [Phycisphaerae bacterium]|nr:sugar phosphate nucleotidyltransferase [Phycisphaerae bacterium]